MDGHSDIGRVAMIEASTCHWEPLTHLALTSLNDETYDRCLTIADQIYPASDYLEVKPSWGLHQLRVPTERGLVTMRWAPISISWAVWGVSSHGMYTLVRLSRPRFERRTLHLHQAKLARKKRASR